MKKNEVVKKPISKTILNKKKWGPNLTLVIIIILKHDSKVYSGQGLGSGGSM
jgi:hypothetical protein